MSIETMTSEIEGIDIEIERLENVRAALSRRIEAESPRDPDDRVVSFTIQESIVYRKSVPLVTIETLAGESLGNRYLSDLVIAAWNGPNAELLKELLMENGVQQSLVPYYEFGEPDPELFFQSTNNQEASDGRSD